MHLELPWRCSGGQSDAARQQAKSAAVHMSTPSTFPPVFAPTASAFAALPPRVAHILQGYLASVTDELRPRLGTMLTEFERQMIEQVETARQHGMQSEAVADLHALRRHRAELPPRVLATVETQLTRLRQPASTNSAATARVPSIDYQALSLVEDAQINQEIVLADIVRRHETRSSMALLLLGQRLGVLAGSPAFELSRIPAGPQSLCHALREAMPALQLSHSSQQLLWHSFERHVLTDYPRLLDALNLMLESSGVLPDLQFIPRRIRSEPRMPRAAGSHPESPRPAASIPPTWTRPAARTSPRESVPTTDLLAALQAMQATPADTGRPQVPKQLRQALLERLRQTHGPQPELASADAATFALLERLYDELGRELRPDAPASALLARLQLPLAQAALRDRHFFLRPQHPARGLLDAVAESGTHWQAGEELDPQLLPLLQQAIEHVCRYYQGDEQVFEQANRVVQRHLQASTHKADLAERRQIEAARGRQRLESARLRARTIIENELRGHPLPAARYVHTLLDQAWTDVLTLAQLRKHEKSETWTELVQLTRRIIDAASSPGGALSDARLSSAIEKALLQVGYPEEEAQAITLRLTGAKADVAALLREHALPARESTPVPPAPPRTPEEQTCLDQLRRLPHGTWFEIARDTPQTGVIRLRLAWYSHEGDHALLLNSRGQRSGEQSLDALARLMARGRARAITENPSRTLDRAWQIALDTVAGPDGATPA
ncbi:MAG: DUF1631 family protein [Pseudomonas sp.]